MSASLLRLRRERHACPGRPAVSSVWARRLAAAHGPLRAPLPRPGPRGSTLPAMRPIVLLSTAGSVDDALRLARALVDERLAACVNVVDGVRSVYRWQGEVETDAEALLVIKTTAERYQELAGRLRELHAYDTPELVRLEVGGGDARYLEWLVGQVRSEGEDAGG